MITIGEIVNIYSYDELMNLRLKGTKVHADFNPQMRGHLGKRYEIIQILGRTGSGELRFNVRGSYYTYYESWIKKAKRNLPDWF